MKGRRIVHPHDVNLVPNFQKNSHNLPLGKNNRIFFSSIQVPQECKNYTLFDNKERNINYRGGSYGCDRSISGWYRFDGAAGTHLPTSCVPRSDTSIIVCETHGVSWLNGSHPSISEGKVTRQVCFSWASNCCVVSTDIDVINCGSYYIYNLVPLASWCQRRYCGT